MRTAVEGLLLRAALLSGHGAQAATIARRLAAVTGAGEGRSCLDAGSPLQLTLDAPGPARLRAGVRLGVPLSDPALDGLLPAGAARRLAEAFARLPGAGHASLGAWLFWSAASQSVYVDLRDPSPAEALARLQSLLDPAQRSRLQWLQRGAGHARPWVLRLHADAAGALRLHLHWLLARHEDPAAWVEAVVPGAWPRVLDVYRRLLRRPHTAGRWVIGTPLDDPGSGGTRLRVGNSGWSLVPEDESKHRAVGELFAALGGERDHAEAMWSLCRGAGAGSWRVGRGCEVEVVRAPHGAAALRTRLFLAPQVVQVAQAAPVAQAVQVA